MSACACAGSSGARGRTSSAGAVALSVPDAAKDAVSRSGDTRGDGDALLPPPESSRRSSSACSCDCSLPSSATCASSSRSNTRIRSRASTASRLAGESQPRRVGCAPDGDWAAGGAVAASCMPGAEAEACKERGRLGDPISLRLRAMPAARVAARDALRRAACFTGTPARLEALLRREAGVRAGEFSFGRLGAGEAGAEAGQYTRRRAGLWLGNAASSHGWLGSARGICSDRRRGLWWHDGGPCAQPHLLLRLPGFEHLKQLLPRLSTHVLAQLGRAHAS